MTSPSGMSCETCQDLLIELVCDELAAETAAAVRAHALKCERCGPELEKLSLTLKASSALGLLSPSPEVERRIMQAAREGIAGRARGPAREAAAAGASLGITKWFARLGSFAMSPQVAMASVLFLVVGIGLYALPFGHNDEQSALRATEEVSDEHSAPPSPAASAAAAPMAQPEPLPQEEGEGRGSARESAKRRERAPEQRELEKAAQVAKDVNALGSVNTSNAAGAEERARRAGAARAERSDGFSESKSARPVQAFPGSKAASGGAALQKPASTGKSLDMLADDFAPSASVQGGGAAPAAQAPARKKEASSAPADRVSASKSGYAPAPSPSAPAPKSAPAPAKVAAPEAEMAAEPAAKSADKRGKSDAPSALEQGIAAAKRGDHAQAESLLKPIASGGSGSERATAMLWLARSLRARGDCAAALNFYRSLTQPVTAARDVLEEAADCNARTGNAAVAERLRARAAVPAKQ